MRAEELESERSKHVVNDVEAELDGVRVSIPLENILKKGEKLLRQKKSIPLVALK